MDSLANACNAEIGAAHLGETMGAGRLPQLLASLAVSVDALLLSNFKYVGHQHLMAGDRLPTWAPIDNALPTQDADGLYSLTCGMPTSCGIQTMPIFRGDYLGVVQLARELQRDAVGCALHRAKHGRGVRGRRRGLAPPPPS